MSFYLLSESNDDDIDDNVKQKVCDWDPVLVCKMITIIVWNKTINFVKYWALFDDFFISLSQCRWFQLSWSMQYWVSASFAGGCLLTSHHQDNIFLWLDWPTSHFFLCHVLTSRELQSCVTTTQMYLALSAMVTTIQLISMQLFLCLINREIEELDCEIEKPCVSTKDQEERADDPKQRVKDSVLRRNIYRFILLK